MRALRLALRVGLLAFGFNQFLFAHSGGLDSNGGHHDRKNGGYHYHRSVPSSPPAVASPPQSSTSTRTAPSRSDSFDETLARYYGRTVARTTARIDAAQSARVVASHDYSSMPHSPPPVKVQLEAKYRVTFVDYHKQDVAGYEDQSDRYMFKLLGGGMIG